MAGRGPAPKAPDQRRRRNEPTAGEWVTLTADDVPKPPSLPSRGKGRGHWSPRTRRAWKQWWSDPVSLQWGPGDRDLVEHLADIYEEWVRDPMPTSASEIRQLRDSLGLSPKGRQDRRWRFAPLADVVALEDELEKKKPAKSRARLKVVDAAAAGG
jgi:hypothetical protein